MNIICPLMSKPSSISTAQYADIIEKEMHYEPCAKEHCAWWIGDEKAGKCCIVK